MPRTSPNFSLRSLLGRGHPTGRGTVPAQKLTSSRSAESTATNLEISIAGTGWYDLAFLDIPKRMMAALFPKRRDR